MIVLWDKIISDLQGTTNSIPEDIEDNSEFLAYLDSQIFFCCSQCNWWCEILEEASNELNLNEFTCQECIDEIS